jgi:hypothetical protein
VGAGIETEAPLDRGIEPRLLIHPPFDIFLHNHLVVRKFVPEIVSGIVFTGDEGSDKCKLEDFNDQDSNGRQSLGFASHVSDCDDHFARTGEIAIRSGH